MNRRISSGARGASAFAGAALLAALFLLDPVTVGANSWKGIEPLKSRRADVERALGSPVGDAVGDDGTLEFKVLGGRVTVFFVTRKFVAAKKLSPELEGTVLQIVLQHENASDTPESLKLDGNKSFEREANGAVAVYRNLRDGLIYTFVGNKLTTTRFSPAAQELARQHKKR